MLRHDIIPNADNKDLSVMKSLASKGKVLNQHGWFHEEIGAPTLSDTFLEEMKEIEDQLNEDVLLTELNSQLNGKSHFRGNLTTNWLMYELNMKIVPESEQDAIGILRQVRQRWLRYLFWKEYQAQNDEKKIESRIAVLK